MQSQGDSKGTGLLRNVSRQSGNRDLDKSNLHSIPFLVVSKKNYGDGTFLVA